MIMPVFPYYIIIHGTCSYIHRLILWPFKLRIMNTASIYSDPVVSCPYDKYHRIALSKIQMHIVKCEKNFPKGYKQTCPYDATHRLFEHELTDHIQNCPKRMVLEPERHQFIRNHGSTMSEFLESDAATSIIDHGESWDKESNRDWTPSIDGRSSIIDCSTGSNFLEQRDPSGCKEFIDPNQDLRRPLGYSEAMLVGGESDKAEASDMESVISVMGVGRGRNPSAHLRLQKPFSFGRGMSLPRNN
ncbi:gametocyte-specific factor 1-like [Diprion similis]|uniref:gametocyte-specific factor 1-like n=1 Tax=Diprion similis TaxID=362088 RepID=UPI001EF95397|nr:gametocyte-specific factor 1-like [Diprion similis]